MVYDEIGTMPISEFCERRQSSINLSLSWNGITANRRDAGEWLCHARSASPRHPPNPSSEEEGLCWE